MEQLDEIVGCRVFVIAENLQVTHSFKIRGSLNKIVKDKDLLKNGVVVTSSGIHAIVTAYSAKIFDIPAIAILRDTAPKFKQDIISNFWGRSNTVAILFTTTKKPMRLLKILMKMKNDLKQCI